MTETGKKVRGLLAGIGAIALFVAYAILRSPVFSLMVVTNNTVAVEGSWFVAAWFELVQWETMFPTSVMSKTIFCMVSILGTICLILFFTVLGRMLLKSENRKILLPIVSSIIGGIALIVAYLGVLNFTFAHSAALEGTINSLILNTIGAEAELVIPPLTLLIVFGGILISVFGVGLFSYQNPGYLLPKPIRLLGMVTGVLGLLWFSRIPILDLNLLLDFRWILAPLHYLHDLGFLLMLEWIFLAGFMMARGLPAVSTETSDTAEKTQRSNRGLSLVFFFAGILILTTIIIDIMFPLTSPRVEITQFLSDWNNLQDARAAHSLTATVSVFLILLAITSLYLQNEDAKGRIDKILLFLAHFGALIAAMAITDLSMIKFTAFIIDDAPPAAIPGITQATESNIALGMFPLALGGILLLTLGVGFISWRVFKSSELKFQCILGLISGLLGIGFVGLFFGEPLFTIALIVAQLAGIVLALWMFTIGAHYVKKRSIQ